MEAYSSQSGQHYPSWEDLVREEANGWTVVPIMTETSARGRVKTYARVIGPFPDKADAMRVAARVRRSWKKVLDEPEHAGRELVTVSVEPAWKEDRL